MPREVISDFFLAEIDHSPQKSSLKHLNLLLTSVGKFESCLLHFYNI